MEKWVADSWPERKFSGCEKKDRRSQQLPLRVRHGGLLESVSLIEAVLRLSIPVTRAVSLYSFEDIPAKADRQKSASTCFIESRYIPLLDGRDRIRFISKDIVSAQR